MPEFTITRKSTPHRPSKLFPLREEPGWHGAFTRESAPGAMPPGTIVVKLNSEPKDANPDGALGVVLGSLDVPDLGVLYFVEWVAHPQAAVACVDWKLRTEE